MAYIKPKLVT